jgi:hypothetical protein
MRVIDVKQNTLEWFDARCGIPTASELDALITPLGKVRTGDGVDTYLAKKLAERWRGEALPSAGSWAMEQGSIREDEAIPWYQFEYDRPVQRVGFITSDDGQIGCSPDGMFTDGTGIEVKCPEVHTHVGYLLDGGLPKAYVAQDRKSVV